MSSEPLIDPWEYSAWLSASRTASWKKRFANELHVHAHHYLSGMNIHIDGFDIFSLKKVVSSFNHPDVSPMHAVLRCLCVFIKHVLQPDSTSHAIFHRQLFRTEFPILLNKNSERFWTRNFIKIYYEDVRWTVLRNLNEYILLIKYVSVHDELSIASVFNIDNRNKITLHPASSTWNTISSKIQTPNIIHFDV